MNTDNMSIASVTIDYGAYAFLDAYDFNYICKHTDRDGRYSFGNQPPIAYWNLSMLARTLSPIVSIERMEKALENFEQIFSDKYPQLMRTKLGLENNDPDDLELIKYLLGVLGSQNIDYTAFFRLLSHYSGNKTDLLVLCVLQTPLSQWLDDYDKRLKQEKDPAQRNQKMFRVNPKYVLKNYILQEAIEKAEEGDNNNTLVDTLLKLAQNPFDEHPEFERYAKTTPSSYQNLKLSCSS